MERALSAEEVSQIVGTARVLAPGFSEEQFRSLVNAQEHLRDSGLCEAAWEIVRLEKERGVPIGKALDAHKQLLQDNRELEEKVTDRRAKLEIVEGNVRQAQDRLHQLEEAIKQAKDELQAVKAERQKEDKGLIAFKKRAEREKKRIDEEVEEYQRKANVTKEEITGTSQLKDQLASRGFTIEFTLDLCQEFVGHENARDELAKGIQEHGTLTKSTAALAEQEKAQKKALESEQAKLKSLEGTRHQLETIISQLRADVAHEEELRRFYHRYQGGSTLMEHLATWRNIFFVKCGNPLYAVTGAFDRSTSGALFWTEKRPLKRCPCCNYPEAFFDEKLYAALNLPIGEPYKLQLGE